MFNRIGLTLFVVAGLILGTLTIVVWTDQKVSALSRQPAGSSPAELIFDLASGEDKIRFTAELVDLTDDTGQNYYVNYRIKREQFRQEVKDMLLLLLESDIRETREKAQEQWLVLSNKIAQEGEIENVLKMLGFKDVVSEVNNGNATITVLTEGFKQNEIDEIKKATSDITGVSEQKVEVKARA